jgi:hypothetical protein
MTLCFVNYHRFHFVLYVKDCVFEELGSVVHGTESFAINQPFSTFITFFESINWIKIVTPMCNLSTYNTHDIG